MSQDHIMTQDPGVGGMMIPPTSVGVQDLTQRRKEELPDKGDKSNLHKGIQLKVRARLTATSTTSGCTCSTSNRSPSSTSNRGTCTDSNRSTCSNCNCPGGTATYRKGYANTATAMSTIGLPQPVYPPQCQVTQAQPRPQVPQPMAPPGLGQQAMMPQAQPQTALEQTQAFQIQQMLNR